MEALFTLAKSRLPTALETKFAEFPTALIDTHGKDLTISADPSRSGTPAPSAGTAIPPPASATTVGTNKPAKKPEEKKTMNTTKVTIEATFMAAADDIFVLLTDEKRIPSWTRAAAQVCF